MEMPGEINKRQPVMKKVRACKSLYGSVVEDLTEVVSRFLHDGTFLFVNDVYCRFFGKEREELLGSKWHPVAVTEDLPLIEEKLRTMSKSNPVVVIENRVYAGTGEVRWMQFVNRGIFDPQGSLLEIQSVGRDFTERKKAEEQLEEQQKFVEAVTRAIPDVIYLYDVRQQRHIFINRELELLLGYSTEEIKTNGVDLLLKAIHPEDLPKVMQHIDILAHTASNAKYTLEYRIKGKDGNYLWFYVREQVYQRDQTQQPEILFGICQDITERKLVEEKLKQSNEEMRLLAKHLSDADEEIRRKIAAELHDRIGQNLTALSLNLNYMKSQLSDESLKQVDSRMIDSMKLLEGTIEQLRDITTELRPALLDEHGLMSALRWHCNQFSERTGIGLLIDESDFIPSLPAVVETAIFRIVQEALHNVSKHAMAQRVEVMFRKMEGKIEIVIKDNGIGFDAEELRKKQSLGLVTMKERAQAINGKISFISEPGKGTTVTLEMPG